MNDAACKGDRSIYVLDPNTTERNELVSILANELWQVKAFENPESLLVQEPLTEKGCVIIEANLQEGSILELLEKLNQRGANTALIALGDQGDLPLAVRLMRAGAVSVIARPFSSFKLIAAVKDALNAVQLNKST